MRRLLVIVAALLCVPWSAQAQGCTDGSHAYESGWRIAAVWAPGTASALIAQRTAQGWVVESSTPVKEWRDGAMRDRLSIVMVCRPAPASPPPSPTPSPTPVPTPVPQPPPVVVAPGAHGYYNWLVALPSFRTANSLRSQDLIERDSVSKPNRWVSYDAAMDAAKVVIPYDPTLASGGNSLRTQVRIPANFTEGHNYLITWDTYYERSWLPSNTGLINYKTFQFDYPMKVGGSPAVWAEVNDAFALAAPGTISKTTMRQYALSIPPGLTAIQPVAPMAGTFYVRPETWVRRWALIELPAFGTAEARISLLAADELTPPVLLLDRVPWVRLAPGNVGKFWLEFNTSTDPVKAGRGDLVAYVRNVVMLRDPEDVPSLLVKPE